MRIAFAKPDFGIRGGFEVVVERLIFELERLGHVVEKLAVLAPRAPFRAFGLDIPERVSRTSFEFFRHMSMVERFEQLDASGFDVLVSTQPPSYACRHPRHLSLFYHHLRICYDLSEFYMAAGFVSSRDHLVTQAAIRRLDEIQLGRVGWFLAPPEVKKRLKVYNDLDNVSEFNVPSAMSRQLLSMAAGSEADHILLVTRHEFPKRAELFVQAMKYVPDQKGVIVGSGYRLEWTRDLDARLSAPDCDLDALEPTDTWLCPGVQLAAFESASSNISFRSSVLDRELTDLYRSATCVVAPALMEDYGLTAVEAMACGKPVIVCEDGGGLADLIEDNVNGLVVAPNARAIAEAVRRLSSDPELARRLGQTGRDMAKRITTQRAVQEFVNGIGRVA